MKSNHVVAYLSIESTVCQFVLRFVFEVWVILYRFNGNIEVGSCSTLPNLSFNELYKTPKTAPLGKSELNLSSTAASIIGQGDIFIGNLFIILQI